MTLSWLAPWLLFLLAGIAILLPLYGKLIRMLRELHPDVYERIGSPTLFMVSPRRGIRLQKFIYRESSDSDIAPPIARLSGMIGILTPIYVAAVLIWYIWGMWCTITNLL